MGPVCKSKNIWACFGKFVKTKKCRSNEGCFLDFRTRNGKIEMIEMGCKQMKAWKNEMKQNGKTPTRGAVDQTQKAGHTAVSAVTGPTANPDLHHLNSKIIKNSCPIGISICNFS